MKKVVASAVAAAVAGLVLAGCAHQQQPMPDNSSYQSGQSGKLGKMGHSSCKGHHCASKKKKSSSSN